MVRDASGRFNKSRQQRAAANSPRAGAVGASVAAVVGAAAVGAVVMYLFDPNHGGERRARARDLAGRALDSGSDAAHSALAGVSQFAGVAGDALHSASEKVGASAAAAYDAAAGAYAAIPNGKHLRETGQHLAAGACDTASGLRDRAGAWLETAKRFLPGRARRERRFSLIGPVVASGAALSTLFIGAGAMWLFDPDRGRARRAWIGQKITRGMREVGDFSSATGRHVRNRVKGYYYGTRSMMQTPEPAHPTESTAPLM